MIFLIILYNNNSSTIKLDNNSIRILNKNKLIHNILILKGMLILNHLNKNSYQDNLNLGDPV